MLQLAQLNIFKTFAAGLAAAALTGCRSPLEVSFHRPLPKVVAAIQQSCARIAAQTNQPIAWITGTNVVPGVSYTVSIQDQFTSYPIGHTEISALSIGPSETQLRVDSVERGWVGWRRRADIEAQTIGEIGQFLEK